MVQPIQYQVPGVASPFENLVSGLKLGATMADIEAAREQRAFQQQAREQEMAMQQAQMQRQQEMANASRDVLLKVQSGTATGADFQGLALMNPQQSENILRVWDSMSKPQQENMLRFGLQTMSALQTNPEIGIGLLDEAATAARNTGDESKAKEYERLRDIAKIDPAKAVFMTGAGIVHLPGGKDAIDSLSKLAVAPVDLATKQAALDKAKVELNFIEREKQAALDNARSVADKAKIEAAFAERMAKAELRLKNAQTEAQQASAKASGASAAKSEQETLKLKDEISRGPLPEFNAQMNGFIVRPTKENPKGSFIPLTATVDAKQQRTAVQSLKTAGYDPDTGEDNITRLIQKSTGSTLGMLTDEAFRFFGGTNAGMKAIGTLEPLAKQMALDLLDGKLGAGIANADRDFIVSTLGDISNPRRTTGEKLSAWNSAKNRMIVSGMLPPPTKTPDGKPIQPSKAPAAGSAGGVDMNNPLLATPTRP